MTKSQVLLISLLGGLLATPLAPAGELSISWEQLPLSVSADTSASIEAEAATDVPADLWQRIRGGLAMSKLDSPLVKTHERWFAAHPEYLRRAIERSRLYLFHIAEAVEKRDMPMEIALLPIVESGFNPKAMSPANASGIWQFIPATGRIYGLKQNEWYDGRRDVLAATRAALDYLENLYIQFGSWELSLAAYNCGEGCVQRAIARNESRGRDTSYVNLDLPTETRHYVPKLMAVRNAILNPERFGLNLDTLPNEPYFRKVSLSYPIEAKTAARLAGMSLEEFLALNPAFQRRVIHSDSQNAVLLPVDKVDAFRVKLEETDGDRIRLKTYMAQKGELLSRIAERFDVSLQWLRDHNPINLRRGKLQQTQALLVPATPGGVAKAPPPEVKNTAPEKPARKRAHTVRKGETLASIARRYNVKESDILAHDDAVKPLKPGTRLAIPLNG